MLGIGGMAADYAATQRNGNRVEIKILHPQIAIDRSVRERFLREGAVGLATGTDVLLSSNDKLGETGTRVGVAPLPGGACVAARGRF